MTVLTTPFGALAQVSITDEPEERSGPDEQLIAELCLGPVRARTFRAGRRALRAALARAGGPIDLTIARDDRGAPSLPAGFAGSIAHKETVAVGLAARGERWLGVDVEYDRPSRVDIRTRVLREEELRRVAAMSAELGERAVRVSFSLKEAVYKAIDPGCRRYVRFHEVALELDSGLAEGEVPVRLHLEPAPGLLEVEAAWRSAVAEDGCALILAFARARLASG